MFEITDNKGNIKAKLWLPVEQIENSALKQIYNMAGHPYVHKWISIMPDVHTGIGATIGAVLPLDGVIVPAAVGVDIGCGICAVKTDLKLNEIAPYLKTIHDQILSRIPLGFEHRSHGRMKDVHQFLEQEFESTFKPYEKWSKNPVLPQVGTLGGGNHFIELQKDSNDDIWIMLHSGSRNIGNLLASEYIKLAQTITKKNKEKLPPALDCLHESSEEGKRYITDMNWAMEFARQNRFVMMKIIKSIFIDIFNSISFEPIINIHHNYAAKEKHYGKKVWVHRKGATKVTDSITGIIPGSMATPSYIVKGKNNLESFNSCSHGAGRVMSRKQARRLIDFDKFKAMMNDIYSESVTKAHIDEAPEAYKNIDEVISYQKDLIEITAKLEPILNIKG